MPDVIIIGGGPAGISAALTLRARNKTVLIVSNDAAGSGLAKAERIDNYPGLPGVTGRELIDIFERQADERGVERRTGRVVGVMPFGRRFMVSIGSDVEETGSVILALGATKAKVFPGEEELLGRGVSYCATCDGMLYRGRDVCVVGGTDEALEEARFLAGIGCRVTYCATKPPVSVPEGLTFLQGRSFEIVGQDKVTALSVDGVEVPCEAVFVLRPAIAPGKVVPGLEVDGSAIVVDAHMATSVPGVFAAGDCVGKPLQVAKAVGEGQLAAFGAVAWLDEA